MSENIKTITGTVEKLIYGGAGLIRHNGLVIFVNGVLPREEVSVEITKMKSHYAEARLLSILNPSPDRVHPRCPHFLLCGGCQLQHVAPSCHASLKQSFLEEAFHSIPHPLIEVTPTQDVWAWRRKITLHVVNGAVGYLGNDNTTLIPIVDCPIFFYPEESKLIASLKALASMIVGQADIACFRLPSHGLAITIRGQQSLPKGVVKHLASIPSVEAFAVKCPSWNYSEGPQEFSFEALGTQWFFSVDAFVQNHPSQSEHLWRAVIDRITTTKEKLRIVDLYAGIGVTAISLARLGHAVTAVEYSKKACLSARRSAADIPIDIVCSTVELAIPKLSGHYDWWIVNPPRTGLSPHALNLLMQQKPKNVLYVSCSPSTLARDCKAITKSNWSVVWGKAFDLFPQTTHFETIVHLERS